MTYPGIFIIYRLGMTLFGESILGFRVFDLVAQLISLGMIFWLGRKLAQSSFAGFLSCIIYSIFYYGLGRWGVGDREVFVLWFFFACLVISFSLKGWRRSVLVGLLIGFVPLIKPTYGLAWLVFGILFLAEGWKEKKKIPWLELSVYALSCFVPAGVLIIYYLSIGHFSDLFQALIKYNFEVYVHLSSFATMNDPYLKFASAVKVLFLEQVLLFFSAIFFLLHQSGAKKSPDQAQALLRTILSLYLVNIISLIIQRKYFSYHMIPAWGLLCILSGPAFFQMALLLTRPETFRPRILAGIFYLGMILLMIANIKPEQIRFALQYCFRDIESAYYSKYESASDYALVTNYYLTAKYLKPRLRDEDQMEFFGVQPLIPFLLQKKIPPRFQNVQHLVYAPGLGRITDFQRQGIREYTQEVTNSRPRFFIITDQQIPLTVDLTEPTVKTELEEQFPELNQFLQENYRLIQRIGLTEIYELNKFNSGASRP